MIFKIVCNNEIHRIRENILSFKQLLEVIQTRFEGKVPKLFCCEYKDSDGDNVRVNCEEDYTILLEEVEGAKSVKIYVKEDLNSTFATSLKQNLESQSNESFENVSDEVEVIEVEEKILPEVLPEENSVLLKIENSVLRSVTQVNTDELISIFNLDKKHYKELMKWVASKKTNQVEELVNLYMNECVEKFHGKVEKEVVIEEEPVEQEEKVEPVVEVQEKLIEDAEDVNEITIQDLEEEPVKVEEPVVEVKECKIEDKAPEKVEEQEVKYDQKPNLEWNNDQWADWKNNNTWSRQQWKEWKSQWTKEEWKQWKNKRCQKWKKCWGKKKEWMNKKFENKFDESIRKAIPQIAVQVAQILRQQGEVNNEGFAPLKDVKVQEEQHKVVHKGYICDGCGVSPIVGVCYKSSVLKDFDFCAKCEATIPHPYPFLKLKSPEQRPLAMLTVINEEGQKPFDLKDPSFKNELFKKASGLFKNWFNIGEKHGSKGGKCAFKEMFGQFKKHCEKKAEKKVEKKVEEKVEEKVEDKTPQPKVETPQNVQPKVEVEEVDPIALSNTMTLLDIFAVDVSQKKLVYQWVKSKKINTVERLVNLFMDEMQGKF